MPLNNVLESRYIGPQITNDSGEDAPSYGNSVIKVASFVPAIFVDLLLLPFAVGLTGLSYLGYNFNPLEIKRGLPAIVLLHGSGFNESEFAVGRYYLNNEKYGSIISFNMEGFLNLIPDRETGIDDLARGIVRDTFKKIVQVTECNSLILIGHSIGGMVAIYYAENLAEEDNITIEHAFTVNSPVKGTPTLDFIWSNISENLKNSKRNHQMSRGGSFWPKLSEQALTSESQGKRTYYNIYSEADWAVPFKSGRLTENPDCILAYRIAGHYSPIALPTTWNWVISKLDNIYNQILPLKKENKFETITLQPNWNWVTSNLDEINGYK